MTTLRTDALNSKSMVSNCMLPRESMTVAELIQIALDAKVLDPIQEGYTLEDGKGNTFALDAVVDLDKINVFFATENEPGPAS